MDKFCSLCFSFLLFLTGCSDSVNKELKSIHGDQKELMDTAKFWGITNLETLGMTLDSTTKSQAIDILESRGYVFAWVGQNFVKALITGAKLENIFPKARSTYDNLKKASMIIAVDPNLSSNGLNEFKRSFNDSIMLIFDENNKLIMFIKRYSENKEAGLVSYEGMMEGSYISKNKRKTRTIIIRKDQSVVSIETVNPRATTYTIFSPSTSKATITAFRKMMERKNTKT